MSTKKHANVKQSVAQSVSLPPKQRGRAIRASALRKAFAKTISIKVCDIPPHLQEGEFFRSLSPDDLDCSIEIPVDCFPGDEEVVMPSLKTFRQLLRVFGFWMLDSIPVGVLDFCEENDTEVWQGAITKHSWALELDVLPALLIAYGTPGFVPVKEIILTGRWDIISHCVDRMEKNSSATAAAALTGNVQVLEFFREEGFEWHKDTCSNCSKFGHLECLKYAHENGCPWDKRVFVYAAEDGYIDCMKYAFERGLQWDVEVCMYASFYGQLECLKFAHENGCPWDDTVMRAAAENGHVNCLKYAHEQEMGWIADICSAAAFNGQLQTLMYAHANGCPWDNQAINSAASIADISFVSYLCEKGCPVPVWSLWRAAQNGYVEHLRCLHTHGGELTDYLAEGAALNNQLECLKYLHLHACPIGEDAYTKAVRYNAHDCVQYLLENGFAPDELRTNRASLSPLRLPID